MCHFIKVMLMLGGMVAQWVALSPHSLRSLQVDLELTECVEFIIFSPCLCGFPLCSPVSSHILKNGSK